MGVHTALQVALERVYAHPCRLWWGGSSPIRRLTRLVGGNQRTVVSLQAGQPGQNRPLTSLRVAQALVQRPELALQGRQQRGVALLHGARPLAGVLQHA